MGAEQPSENPETFPTREAIHEWLFSKYKANFIDFLKVRPEALREIKPEQIPKLIRHFDIPPGDFNALIYGLSNINYPGKDPHNVLLQLNSIMSFSKLLEVLIAEPIYTSEMYKVIDPKFFGSTEYTDTILGKEELLTQARKKIGYGSKMEIIGNAGRNDHILYLHIPPNEQNAKGYTILYDPFLTIEQELK